MSDLNIYQRRNAAKKQVFEHEFKKEQSQGLKFKYIPVEQIKPIVERAWNVAGIVMNIISLEIDDVAPPLTKESTNPYGEKTSSIWYHKKGTLKFELVNIEKPEDRVAFEIEGEAKDNSDKVINKIYTSAIKNFYKIEFNISEGAKDDIDAIQSDDALEVSTGRGQPPTDDPFFGKGNGGKDEGFTSASELKKPKEEKPKIKDPQDRDEAITAIDTIKSASAPARKVFIKMMEEDYDGKALTDLTCGGR